MSDPRLDALPPPALASDDKVMPMVVYGLFLAGLITAGLTSLVGVVLAYNHRRTAGERAASHYIFQIRTFWLSLGIALALVALFVVAIPLSLLSLGLLSPLLAAPWTLGGLLTVWFVVRCIVGLVFLGRDEAYPRPRTWLI